MRVLCKTVVLLGLALLLAEPSAAQDKDKKKGNRGGGFGVVGLLTNESVQKELKLGDEQIEKAKKAAEELRGKFREDAAKLKDATPAERAEFVQKVSDEAYKVLNDVLKPEQVKRLKQIELQQTGLSSPAAQKALKLTDEQKEKVKKIAEETTQKRREIMKEAQGDFKGAMEKVATLTKESHEKEGAVLTDEQKKQWKEMTGEPFQIKFEFRRPGKSDT
jgi:hypothetical protein